MIIRQYHSLNPGYSWFFFILFLYCAASDQLFFKGEEIEERITLTTIDTLISADLVVSISFVWSRPVISLRAELCVFDYISCLHGVPVLQNYELEENSCSQGKD